MYDFHIGLYGHHFIRLYFLLFGIFIWQTIVH